MATAKLTYDATTYRLSEVAVADLVARGVILREESSGDYTLAPEHLIEEVEPLSDSVERPGAPSPGPVKVPKAPWWARLPR